MKNTLSEMKNNLQENNRRVDELENQSNNLKYKEAKNTQSEQQEEKRIQKNKDSVRNLWDNFECTKICIIGVPEREERKQDIGNLFEKVMKEKFPNLVKEIDMQVQEAQRVPNKMDAKRPTPRHLIIKMPKVKDK